MLLGGLSCKMAGISDKFPLLLPCDKSFKTYEGYIRAKGYQFWIRVGLAEGGNPPLLNLDWQLGFLLKGLEDAVTKKLTEASTLVEFLEYFCSFIENLLQTKGIGSLDCSSKSNFCESVILELDQIGWDRVKSVSDDLSSVVLVAWDEGGREHHLDCHLSPDHPNKTPLFHADLPVAFSPRWRSKNTLKDILVQFKKELTCYQNFWNILDEIDNKVWVLSPKAPNRSARRRLFAFGHTMFIQMVLNPLHPHGVPDVKFVGPDKSVEEYHKRLSCAMDTWSEEVSILKNFERILQVEIPSRKSLKREEVCKNCGVCLEHEGEDEAIPEIFCNDERCGQVFHKACIVEWIRTRPESRMTFNTILGLCPYCKQSLQVTL